MSVQDLQFPNTNAKLRQMDPQEVFNTVATHLLTQNEQSVIDGRFCKYRLTNDTGKTLMCAAGCLIDDEDYDSQIEGLSWKSLADDNRITVKHRDLIRDLQCVHDENQPHDWPDELKSIAREYHLSTEVIDNATNADQ